VILLLLCRPQPGMKKPGAASRRQPGLPACANKKPISGKPEIGAHFLSFYFPMYREAIRVKRKIGSPQKSRTRKCRMG
jgi:hypothetical protein